MIDPRVALLMNLYRVDEATACELADELRGSRSLEGLANSWPATPHGKSLRSAVRLKRAGPIAEATSIRGR